MSVQLTHPPPAELTDPHLLRQVNELRQTDNTTNWYYLAREYLVLAAIVGGTIFFYESLAWDVWSWVWAAPVTIVAIALIGAGQHRLVTLTHEASHYMLFKNRRLNEFISEWFCMYPVLGTTHKYRVQHLGHHQFPNDPKLDPDFIQLHASGHRFQFPMTRWQFLWHGLIKQLLWPPYPIRYALVRATFDGTNGKEGPYRLALPKKALVPIVSIVYIVTLIAMLAYAAHEQRDALFAIVPGCMLAGIVSFYALVSAKYFATYFIKSDLPPRLLACLRVTYYTLVVTAIFGLTRWTGSPWWLYYFVLWLTPLGTSFSLFMILRQLVQHGNADQERFTNTRIFRVAWPIAASVFPIGNDYHLPHHLFPMVPHYNLRKLHDLLMSDPAYRDQAVLVDGYFFPHDPPENPTVLDLMTR